MVEDVRIEMVRGFDPDKLTDAEKKRLFTRRLVERAHGKCGNCGSTHKVRGKMIVPLAAGGRFAWENGTTLCRACEMAAAVVARDSTKVEKRPVNFWTSQRQYHCVRGLKGFTSVGALVRFLMGRYLAAPDRFDDLHLWQEAGSEMKINVWVEIPAYEAFKKVTNARGMTVTDAFKSLLRLYEEEGEPRVAPPDGNKHE